jgi:hypothetical protein
MQTRAESVVILKCVTRQAHTRRLLRGAREYEAPGKVTYGVMLLDNTASGCTRSKKWLDAICKSILRHI